MVSSQRLHAEPLKNAFSSNRYDHQWRWGSLAQHHIPSRHQPLHGHLFLLIGQEDRVLLRSRLGDCELHSCISITAHKSIEVQEKLRQHGCNKWQVVWERMLWVRWTQLPGITTPVLVIFHRNSASICLHVTFRVERAPVRGGTDI